MKGCAHRTKASDLWTKVENSEDYKEVDWQLCLILKSTGRTSQQHNETKYLLEQSGKLSSKTVLLFDLYLKIEKIHFKNCNLSLS